MIRISGGAVAIGLGAVDAYVATKVTARGPAGVPWQVILEGGAAGAALFHRQLGIDADIADPLGISALTLIGARTMRIALAGKLMAGPAAWGGDNTYQSGGQQGVFAIPRNAPVLSRAAATGLSPTLAAILPMQEKSGVAG